MTDLARKASNSIGLGIIAEVDHPSARVKVNINGRLTGWLQTPAEIGNNFIRWRPLRIGTQVLTVSPGGDPANAIIAQILYSAALAPPADKGEIDLIKFDDGTTLQYDSEKHELSIHCVGDIHFKADGIIWLDAARIRVFEGG